MHAQHTWRSLRKLPLWKGDEMTDRELLDAAAKACSIQNAGYTTGRGLHVNPDNEYASGWWNPLTDDGDALRLAVALQIVIDWTTRSVHTLGDPQQPSLVEDFGGDLCAATRRAIVRAAAEMGKHGTP
jgi:hypothetical protein